MKCFNHPEIDATGFCRSCGRALCRDCVCDVSGITSCKGRCEANVQKLRNQTRQVQDMIKTVETWRKPPKPQPKRVAWLMGLAAAVFLGFGIFLITKPSIDDGAHYLVLSIGLFFAWLCVFRLRQQRKVVPNTTQQPTPNALPALPAQKCSNHPEIEGIGFCRNCGRTLCRNCATTVSDYLCCKGQCEKATTRMLTKLRFARFSIVFLKFIIFGRAKWILAAALFIGLGVWTYVHPAPKQDYGLANGSILVGVILGCRFVWLTIKSSRTQKDVPNAIPPILRKQ